MAFVESDDMKDVASEVMSILGDPVRIERMREAGYERMGEQGAAKRIAKIIIDFIETGSWEGR